MTTVGPGSFPNQKSVPDSSKPPLKCIKFPVEIYVHLLDVIKEEIRNAIRQLRKGMAAGPDKIPAEALKADVETTVEMLYPLFEKIWEDNKYDQSGKKATSWRSQRKATLVPAQTTEELRSCHSQERCSTESS